MRMAIRFHPCVKLLPGLRLNFGRRGVGISAGVRGLHVGVDFMREAIHGVSIPGTNLPGAAMRFRAIPKTRGGMRTRSSRAC